MIVNETSSRKLEIAWERATERAMVEHISVIRMGDWRRGYDLTVDYDATSSHRGSAYRVTVRYSANGVESTCSCPAGQHGIACKHQAAALCHEGWLPIPAVPSRGGAELVGTDAVPEPALPVTVNADASHDVRTIPAGWQHYYTDLARAASDPQFG